MHQELELLVDAGLRETEALRAATLSPAEFLERTDSLGTVEEGKLADLVLLDVNPLDDISNTQKIHAVMANGRYFDREALDELLQVAERAAKESKSNKELSQNHNNRVYDHEKIKTILIQPALIANNTHITHISSDC